MLKENNQRMRYLSYEECQTLIDVCESHLKPIVITALNTGMRKGEILNLKWDDVDLKNGFIFVRETKNGDRRDIPINQKLRSALESLYRGSKKNPRQIHIPYVFYYYRTGNPFLDVKRSFTTALRKAGIKDFRFHDLRHTFASQLVMAGADIAAVRELLGHKTLTMTLRYSHLAPNHKVQTVKLLDGIVGEDSTSQLLHNMVI
jgi:integrase